MPRKELSDYSIPLPTAHEEHEMMSSPVPETLPILALRNTVLFPGVVLPITVGRASSLSLTQDAAKGNKLIGVIAQRVPVVEVPEPDDLYDIGTVATILKRLEVSSGTTTVFIQGVRRFSFEEDIQRTPYIEARVRPLDEYIDDEGKIKLRAQTHAIKELASQIISIASDLPSDATTVIDKIQTPGFLIHFIASHLQINVEEKQKLLSTVSLLERAELITTYLQRELRVQQLSEEIRSRIKNDVDKQQKEFFLRQQMRVIQEELGEGGEDNELDEFQKRADDKQLPDRVRETLQKELKKLARINPAAPDYAVTRNYVDWILDLPWDEYSEDHLDITHAESILNEDHYGLEQVKKRILEYLSVLKLKGDMKAPILCFHGPPGVGKTSLGKSIARAIGREFVRVSLGGVRDEAEIRGHRRTYVGSLPGRILQNLKKAGTSNPVFMLDEVDKLGSDFRGDPSSALLEVLDPEQNIAFNDHYLELDYDLSKVLFIATANYLDMIPTPLRDRMELIQLTGYIQDEKLAIAKGFLVPRQTERNGLQRKQFKLTDKALEHIIDGYTRESGVRQLERTIGAVARGVAKKVAVDASKGETVTPKKLEGFLGGRKFFSDVAEHTEVPGVATGLAWTATGGDILFVEASISQGTGQLILTGQLGDIMKESAQAALSYVKSQADELAIPQYAFRHWDVHVHVPAGAVPKDGPSAGIAILSALVSIFTQRRVAHDVAMTGEITLRGLVLPVGGIKEKVLAARRAGIKRVLLPHKNEKDIKEIKEKALDGLDIQYVKRVGDALLMNLEKNAVTDPAVLFAHAESNGKPADPLVPEESSPPPLQP